MPAFDEPMSKDDHFVAGAFKLVDEVGFYSLERKEKMLKLLYETLRGTCSPWIKWEDHVCY